MADTLAGALIEAQASSYTGRMVINEELVINDQTRTIQIPNNELLFGVESDEKAERKYFRCPRYVGDNIDLMEIGLQINYRNAKGEEDIYIVSDKEVIEESDDITFSWLLSRKVTRYKGQVTFIICATRLQDNKIINEWNTTLAHGNVIEGLEVNDILIEEPEIDVLRQLIQLTEEMSIEAKQASKTANESLTEVQETSVEVITLKTTLEDIIEQATDLLERLDGLDKKTEITYEIVEVLPETGENGVIYLVPVVTRDAENSYIEYLWIESLNKFEPIGELPQAEIWVDDVLSETSENPVQNKVIMQEFQNLPPIINNLTTTTPGQGSLDAYQANFLCSLSGVIGITSGTDLNSLTQTGNYTCISVTTANSLLNCPIKQAFDLKIGIPAANVNSVYRYQKIINWVNNLEYYRTYDGVSWTNWVDLSKFYKSLTTFTEIPSGADLKSATYLVPGNYKCPSNTRAEGLINCPTNSAFTLEVSYAVGDSTYIKQTFYEFTGRKILIRTKNMSSGAWISEYTYTGNSELKYVDVTIPELTLNSNGALGMSDRIPSSIGNVLMAYICAFGEWQNGASLTVVGDAKLLVFRGTPNATFKNVHVRLWYK